MKNDKLKSSSASTSDSDSDSTLQALKDAKFIQDNNQTRWQFTIGTPAHAFMSSLFLVNLLKKHNLTVSVKLFFDGSGCFCFNPYLGMNSQLDTDDWVSLSNLFGIELIGENPTIVKGELYLFFTYEMRNWTSFGKQIDSFKLNLSLVKELH